MTIQNYFVIDKTTNICVNKIVCDDKLLPVIPNSLLIPADSTPAKVWQWVNDEWVLGEVVGAGDMGDTWDGTYLITNKPKPKNPGTVQGAQTF